jgi:hypothetical protein
MRSFALLMMSSALVAAPVLAQTTAPASTPANAPTATKQPSAAAPTGAASAAMPGPGATTAPATTNAVGSTSSKGGAAAATPAVAVATGAKVVDTSGAAVGAIDSVSNGVAVLNTGTVKVSVPVTSFAAGPNGPIIALTKSEIEAKAAAATQALSIAVGATVNDTTGAKVGTVKAVTGDMVTVASATANAQLPKSAFAPGAGGALVIGMSAAQFDAAAKAAGGAKPRA